MNKQRKIQSAMSAARGVSAGLKRAGEDMIFNQLNNVQILRQSGKTMLTEALISQAFMNMGADSFILPRAHAILRRFHGSLKFNYKSYNYDNN